MHDLLSSLQFIEWLPCNTLRYENTPPVRLLATVIPGGLLNKQSFQQKLKVLLPEGWEQYLNCAEGRPYYWSSGLGIFTESNITEAHILNRLIKWARILESLMNQSSGSDYDIVLRVSEDEGDGMGTCHYYLVDHTSKVIFWLREVSTSALGLSDVRSPTHLKLLLSEQYWTHCEYMPPPHKDFKQEAKELLATLGTLCIDASSSTGSVSPFHQDECESYSRALAQVISNGGPTEINWCLARLQSLLTQSRIINLHGEHNARADRNVLVNGQKAPPETIIFMILSFIMFSIPKMYLARWNAAWVDRVTYTREWKKLTKDMIEEYTYSLFGSGIMLIASILLWGLSSSLVVRVLASIAMMSSICGGFYSASLFSTLRSQGACAADAANFIQMNEHITTGLQGMALKHSVPWALIMWSGLCLFISGFWEIFRDMIEVSSPDIRVSGKDMIVPALVIMTYLYGRGYFSFSRLFAAHHR
ncbi:unnamed protein product [Rhizoctonia solani]|uniref:Uncharacterized protein n=1 Tax=Rhizoctonia solani TaxID=456999 RepID=A0A8H2XMW4_9AGAM|nr:unnamed protein product [Rhizoctonia solani]